MERGVLAGSRRKFNGHYLNWQTAQKLGEDKFIVCYHLRILISTALAFCALRSCLGGADVIAQKALSSEGEFICPIYRGEHDIYHSKFVKMLWNFSLA